MKLKSGDRNARASMKKLKFFLVVSFRPTLMWLLVLVAVAAVMFFRLNNLVPSISPVEAPTLQHLRGHDISARGLLNAPLYLPYNLGVYTFEKLHLASPFVARSLSALIGLAAVVSFYYILSRWHTTRIAILGSLLLLTSSWFLHTVRLATPDVSFLLLLPLVACGAWLNDTNRHDYLTLGVAAVAGGLLLYIPGMVWFLVVGLFWQRKRLQTAFKSLKPGQILLVVLIGLGMLVPLILAAIDDPNILKSFVGLPQQVIPLHEIGSRLIEIPKQLFLVGPNNPSIWVGNMPLLDAFAGAMFIIGIYAYYSRMRLDRAKLLLFGLLMGSLLIIAGTAPMSFLLPFVYIIVAAGMTFMIQRWLTVFPRNPLARGLGWTLITLAVFVASFYNLSHYFVAWPNAPETKQTFSEPL